MSGSFRRLRTWSGGWRFSAPRLAWLAVVGCAGFAQLSCLAQAREEYLSRSAQTDRSVLIQEHAGWNRDCEAIPHPALYLSSPPRHGKVCARLEKIKITSMYAGTESQCIGHMVRGVRLIYQPDEAFVGDDVIQYAAQYPSALRTISVRITVKPNSDRALAISPPEFLVPSAQKAQLPGPVPDCPQLLF